MTPAELFETFRESAFRLETLQYYVLAEDEPRRRAFREGRPLPPRPGKTDSMRLVRNAVAAGRRVHRVHVVVFPAVSERRHDDANRSIVRSTKCPAALRGKWFCAHKCCQCSKPE